MNELKVWNVSFTHVTVSHSWETNKDQHSKNRCNMMVKAYTKQEAIETAKNYIELRHTDYVENFDATDDITGFEFLAKTAKEPKKEKSDRKVINFI